MMRKCIKSVPDLIFHDSSTVKKTDVFHHMWKQQKSVIKALFIIYSDPRYIWKIVSVPYLFSTFPHKHGFHCLIFPMFSIWKAVESGETPLYISFIVLFPVDKSCVKIIIAIYNSIYTKFRWKTYSIVFQILNKAKIFLYLL